MDLITGLIDFILHIDRHLADFVTAYGGWTNAILFLIIFCETGLVFTPFLPGDSLLFAAGALAAQLPEALPALPLFLLLTLAAILGDTVNYWIGATFGRWLLARPRPLIKPEHLKRTEEFYARHGGKTIILARFVPIVRTFAPFVAGLGHMAYPSFITYNVIGAILWTGLFIGAGYLFGNVPFVQANFELVAVAIVLVSVLPILVEVVRNRTARRSAAPE